MLRRDNDRRSSPEVFLPIPRIEAEQHNNHEETQQILQNAQPTAHTGIVEPPCATVNAASAADSPSRDRKKPGGFSRPPFIYRLAG